MSAAVDLITAVQVRRTYQLGSKEINALTDVSMTVGTGQFVAVVGRSGSGKTTLLNLLGGLDQPTSGVVLFEGRDLSQISEDELIDIRRCKIGIAFQSFSLLPLLSALENVELPLRIAGISASEREERARDALAMVGLSERARHRPYELSGGEQQRVAIARSTVIRPRLILADEPTGELDSANARTIFALFKQMVLEQGISVVAATHDPTLLEMADEVKELRDGTLSDHVKADHVKGTKRFRT